MKYLVTRKEVWDSIVEVEADSPEQAIKKVANGQGEDRNTEYNRTLDPDTWNVEEDE